MCKFDQYLHTSRKSGINVYAICVGWVNFVHNLRCLLKNLRSQQKFYATAGPTGPDKYHLCEILNFQSQSCQIKTEKNNKQTIHFNMLLPSSKSQKWIYNQFST